MNDDLPDLITEATEVLRLTARVGQKAHARLSIDGGTRAELDALSADIVRRIQLADLLDAHAARLRVKLTPLEVAMRNKRVHEPVSPA